MSGTRLFVQFSSIAMLLLWSAVLLYFYLSERVAAYLPPDGIFRPMVLVSGIGLAIVGLFNLLTLNAEDAGCEGHGCGHDHDDHDHDHGCGQDHKHDHSCEHGHAHAHAHSHTHGTKECCGHDHDHDHHDHGAASSPSSEGCSHGTHATCKHEHPPVHSHSHDEPSCCGHEHGSHSHAHHGHGILEESQWGGRIFALLVLAAPISWAALLTPDQYSPNAVINKGLYNQNYGSNTRADQFTLRGDGAAVKPAAAAPGAPAVSHVPPAGGSNAATPTPGADPAKAPQSYGSFTLEDLKQQVPQSSDGNFILDVPEIYYTAGDLEVQKVITGQAVETTAQVLPEKVNNENGHRLRIFRMMVQCCAADARPYSIPVDFGKKAPEFKDMTWVKVIGTLTFKQEGGQTVPVLEAKKIEETAAPQDAMIY